jgi:hypothetical protein
MKLAKNNLTIKSFIVTSFVASVMFAAKPSQAATFTVNVGGTDYDITTITGSYVGNASLLQSQVWWNDTQLAFNFANAVNLNLGLPILGLFPTAVGPLFAYASNTPHWNGSDYWVEFFTARATPEGQGLFTTPNGAVWDQANVTYAIASAVNPAAVPEPLTILGAMTAAGFGVGFKRKLAESQKDKKD